MAVTGGNTLEETRTFNARLAEALATLPAVSAVPIEVTRRAREEGRGTFPAPLRLPRAHELTAPTRAGSVRVRILPPKREPAGVYVHLHGGGFCLGGCDQQDPRLAALADATGLVAASVEYRLAPEHPFPAALDDCEDAARWLLAHADALGAPPRFAIGGESAGAYLAATTLLRLPRGSFAAANLVYGVYDWTQTPSRRAADETTPILTESTMRFFDGAFFPEARPLDDPAVSPLYADLRGLPPALFTVGTLDPLLDDSLFMHARWQAAGNRAELRVFEECVHGFDLFPIAAAREANDAQHEFLKEALA